MLLIWAGSQKHIISEEQLTNHENSLSEDSFTFFFFLYINSLYLSIFIPLSVEYKHGYSSNSPSIVVINKPKVYKCGIRTCIQDFTLLNYIFHFIVVISLPFYMVVKDKCKKCAFNTRHSFMLARIMISCRMNDIKINAHCLYFAKFFKIIIIFFFFVNILRISKIADNLSFCYNVLRYILFLFLYVLCMRFIHFVVFLPLKILMSFQAGIIRN